MANITIARNAVTAKLIDADLEIKHIVSDALSYTVAGAEYSETFKRGRWDGRSTFFKYKSSTFPAGFATLISDKLKRCGHKVRIVAQLMPPPLGVERPNVNAFGYTEEYSYQPEAVDELVKRGSMIAQLATGCHAKGTGVLMFSGSVKNVEDVIIGDKLMGPDSKPRVVGKLFRGREKMCRITPIKGDSYTVNESHVLSLRMTGMGVKRLTTTIEGVKAKVLSNEIVNISVKDYLLQSKGFKHCAKWWRAGVDFKETSLDGHLPAYILGGWLGEVSRNPMLNSLRGLGVYEDKHIPNLYKINSREVRLEVLAGILDTGGHLGQCGYDIVVKQERFGEDIAFVCRSLGFSAYIVKCEKGIKSSGFVGAYYRLSISGNVDEIPCRVKRRIVPPRNQKKNVTNTGFLISEKPVDDYYGFSVDSDSLYLLGDFSVTHNSGKSHVAAIAIARIKRPALFVTTRGVLMYQMKRALEESIEHRSKNGEPELSGFEVGVIGDGIWRPKKITVAMVQTLAAKLKDPSPFDGVRDQEKQRAIQDRVKGLLSKFELVILEEAHEASGESYFNILAECKNAHYRLALTATPFMKDDAEDNMRLMACAGSVGVRVTEKELIDKGILAKPYFKYINNPKPSKVSNSTGWQRAYKLGIVECVERNDLIVGEVEKMRAAGLSVIVLVQHTNHGTLLSKLMKEVCLNVSFIRGSSSQAVRQEALTKLGDGKIDVLIGTNVIDVGVDVPSVGAIILAGGGKAEVALRQRIGRGLRRKKAGPNVAFVVDFLDEYNSHTRDHARQRRYIVEKTEGFGENILSGNDDFDYTIFKK